MGRLTEEDEVMLEEFIAEVRKDGLAKPNLFKVQIIFPSGIYNNVTKDFFEFQGINQRDAFRVSLFCETTELPGKAVVSTPIKTHGPPVKIPYNIQLEDVPMVFYVGEDMKEKRFFDAWQSMIGNPNTGDMNYFDEYTTTVRLTQLTENGEDAYTLELKNAYPIVMSPLTLSMADGNNIHRLPIVFAYRKWDFIPTHLLGTAQGIQELELNSGPISSKLFSDLEPLVRSGLKRLTNKFNITKDVHRTFNLFK